MKTLIMLLSALALAVPATASAGTAPSGAHALWQQAKPYRPKPRPQRFDPKGWTKLGEKWVTGRRDRDVFRIGARRGAFTHLTVVVEGSDLEMWDMVVTFGNRERFEPKLRHTFREGTRSRPIDLPGYARNVNTVEFRYGNLPGGGRARVAIYGRDATPRAEPPRWESAGWERLGERQVVGRRDKDRIRVGRRSGPYTKLTVVVSDGDLEMRDMVVTFGNREKWSPPLRHVFKNGSRSRVIDLPGQARKIRSIDFKYGNLSYGGRARVAVYGRNFGGGHDGGASRPDPNYRPEPGPDSRPSPAWNPRGWTKLGTQEVRGRRDHDTIRVGRRAGAWKALTLQVGGSDVEIHDMVVTFGNNQRWEPKIRHRFHEGAWTRSIDLPGHVRKIKKIDFRYSNLPGGGRANVTVWAR